MPIEIKCPNCCGVFLETTAFYRPDRHNMCFGRMLQFTQKYRERSWSLPFGPDDTGEAIECPGCSAPQLIGGWPNLDGKWELPEEEGQVDLRERNNRIIDMRESGRSYADIAREIGISAVQVGRIINAAR